MTIDEQIYRLITRQGFIDEFWAELRVQREANPRVTHREVYEVLESRYEGEFGETKFPSFEAFLKERDKVVQK